jgi:hypothetical protein
LVELSLPTAVFSLLPPLSSSFVSSYPRLRLCARSVALKFHHPRARLSANWLDAVIRKTCFAQETHATELRHRYAHPSHRSIPTSDVLQDVILALKANH